MFSIFVWSTVNEVAVAGVALFDEAVVAAFWACLKMLPELATDRWRVGAMHPTTGQGYTCKLSVS